MLDENKINSFLSKPHSLYLFTQTDSTNKRASYLAQDGEKDGTVVIAESQSEGRGRLGRAFFSPVGSGIYFSIILRKIYTPAFITCAAACAVCKSIEKYSDTKPLIKWVNDIYTDEKKVCGILAERKITGQKTYDILGIGINIREPDGGFPDYLDRAGSIFGKRGEKDGFSKESFVSDVINYFDEYYASGETEKVYSEYSERMFLTGKSVIIAPVYVHSENEEYKATVVGVNRDFSLSVKRDNRILSVNSGEVTLILR